MGQKANINSLHLTRNIDWNCVWYSNEKEYPSILIEDITILNYLKSCDVLNKGSEVLKVRICRISKNIVIDPESVIVFIKVENSIKKLPKEGREESKLSPMSLKIPFTTLS